MDMTTNDWARRRTEAWERKCTQVTAIATTLESNPVAALCTDLSGYGEGGWHEITGELDEDDRMQIAVVAWYELNALPVPELRDLIEEVRRIRATTVPQDHGRGTVSDLAIRLHWGWDAKTCADPDRFDNQNHGHAARSYGQAAVTALVVQQLMGGDLLQVNVTDNFGIWRGKPQTVVHQFNLLPCGTEIDLTRGQFGKFSYTENVTAPELVARTELLADPGTRARYQLLADGLDEPYVD